MFNRSKFPTGGWMFRQPETGWVAPTPLSSTFDQTCVLIRQMRLANLAITRKHNLATDMRMIELELERYTRKRLGLPEAEALPFPSGHNPPRGSMAGAVAARVKKLMAGYEVLHDWLGSGGKPVASELAEGRARVCAGCEKNEAGDYTRWFTVPASELIRRKLEQRAELKLETTQDAKLGVCAACLCPLKLKVHTPLAHVREHLSEEVRGDLVAGCWILKEADVK